MDDVDVDGSAEEDKVVAIAFHLPPCSVTLQQISFWLFSDLLLFATVYLVWGKEDQHENILTYRPCGIISGNFVPSNTIKVSTWVDLCSRLILIKTNRSRSKCVTLFNCYFHLNSRFKIKENTGRSFRRVINDTLYKLVALFDKYMIKLVNS